MARQKSRLSTAGAASSVFARSPRTPCAVEDARSANPLRGAIGAGAAGVRGETVMSLHVAEATLVSMTHKNLGRRLEDVWKTSWRPRIPGRRNRLKRIKYIRIFFSRCGVYQEFSGAMASTRRLPSVSQVSANIWCTALRILVATVALAAASLLVGPVRPGEPSCRQRNCVHG